MPKNEEIIIRPANLADAKAIVVILRELGWQDRPEVTNFLLLLHGKTIALR